MPSIRGADRGWRVRLRVQLQGDRGERWHVIPPEIGTDGKRHRGLSYDDARASAQWHANSGRRARIVDPEGRESDDVPPVQAAPLRSWRLAMQ